MATSTGSLETSANSLPNSFSISSPFTTSFSELLAGGRDEENERMSCSNGVGGGVGMPKSLHPPSLLITFPPISPSSYFAIPAGLSPAELLGSPVLHSSYNVCSSRDIKFQSRSFLLKCFQEFMSYCLIFPSSVLKILNDLLVISL